GHSRKPHREPCRIEPGQLAPMRARLERRKLVLDDLDQCADLCWVIAPGESDAQAVALVGGTEPELIAGAGADLRRVQMRCEPLPEPAEHPQRWDRVPTSNE